MRKIQLLTVLLLFLSNTVLYLIYNDKAYHLGIDCFFRIKGLPFHLKPNFDDSAVSDYQFYISDIEDYPVIGAGFKFIDSNVEIKRITGYGYNNKYLIVKIIDKETKEDFFITDVERTAKNDNTEVGFKELDYNDLNKYNINLRWTYIDVQEIYKIRFIRNILFSFLIIQIFFIYRKLSKIRNEA